MPLDRDTSASEFTRNGKVGELLSKVLTPGSVSDHGLNDIPNELDARIEDALRILEKEGAAQVNWNDLLVDCAECLSLGKKDYKLSSYAALAWVYTDRLSGLIAGLQLFEGLVGNFWDSAYPPARRLRARVGIFDWFAERATNALRGTHKPRNISRKDVDAVEAAMNALEKAFESHDVSLESLGGYVSLCSALSDWKARARSKQEIQPQKPDATAGTGIGRNAGDAPAQSETTNQNLDQRILTLQKTLLPLAKALREKDVSDPRAYAILREGIWMQLRTPPTNQNSRTEIPAPNSEFLAQVTATESFSDPVQIIESCEALATHCLFLFKLHKMSAEALEKLGHQTAAGAVKVAVQGFMQRMPHIERLAFVDGTPFADDNTKSWLQTLTSSLGGEGTGFAIKEAVYNNAGMQAAKEALDENRIQEALDHLTQTPEPPEGSADYFEFQEIALRIMLAIERNDTALSLSQLLIKKIEGVPLAQWAPAQAARLISLLQDSFSQAAKNGLISNDHLQNYMFALSLSRSKGTVLSLLSTY